MSLHKMIISSMLLYIAICQISPVPIVGGYTPYFDFENSQFLKIIQALEIKNPELVGYQVVSAQRQLVNGFNYLIVFQGALGKFQVRAYQSFSGNVEIMDVKQTQVNVVPADTEDTVSAQTNTAQPQNIQETTNNNQQAQNNQPEGQTTQQTQPEGQTTQQSQPEGQTTPEEGTPQNTVPITVPVVVEPPTQTGSFSRVEEKDDLYNAALEEVYQKHPSLKEYELTQAYEQIVAGKNFKFHFTNNQSNKQVEVVVYVDLMNSASLKSYTVTNPGTSVGEQSAAPNSNTGNELTVGSLTDTNHTDSEEYKIALEEVLKVYPDLNDHDVVGVKEQIVAGVNFEITFQSKENTNKVMIKVFVDLQKTPEIIFRRHLNAKCYSDMQLSYFTSLALEQRPKLKEYIVISYENIWKNCDGLIITFKKENKFSYVYIYEAKNGKTVFFVIDKQ